MNNNNDNWIIILIFVLGLGAFGVWKFSQAFDLDFSTGLDVLVRLGPIIVAWICIYQFSPITFKDAWPLVLASVWFSSWPALDYWAGLSAPSDFIKFEIIKPAWYAMWYTKWGVFTTFVGIWYAIRARLNY